MASGSDVSAVAAAAMTVHPVGASAPPHSQVDMSAYSMQEASLPNSVVQALFARHAR